MSASVGSHQADRVQQEGVAVEIALRGDTLIGRSRHAARPRDRDAALQSGDQLVGIDEHDGRRRGETVVVPEGGEQQPVGVAGGVHCLGEPVDVVLRHAASGDARGCVATATAAGFEHELVVADGSVERDDVRARVGQQELHQLSPIVAR